jgi:hypothetical protein
MKHIKVTWTTDRWIKRVAKEVLAVRTSTEFFLFDLWYKEPIRPVSTTDCCNDKCFNSRSPKFRIVGGVYDDSRENVYVIILNDFYGKPFLCDSRDIKAVYYKELYLDGSLMRTKYIPFNPELSETQHIKNLDLAPTYETRLGTNMSVYSEIRCDLWCKYNFHKLYYK